MSICFAVSEVDWALTKDAFSMIGTLASVFGVAIAAYVGISGLRTWRRQFKGTGDHELARRILIDLYSYRNSINHVRSPAMWGHEVTLSDMDKVGLNEDQARFKGTSQGYQRRLESVDKVRVSLASSLLESEAVWNAELQAKFEPLFKLQHELWAYIHFHLIIISPYEDSDKKSAYAKVQRGKRDLLYYDPFGENDNFNQEFEAALKCIEEYVRDKLVK